MSKPIRCLRKYVNKLHELTLNVPPRRIQSKPYISNGIHTNNKKPAAKN